MRSRADAFGLFWNDPGTVSARAKTRAVPPVPDTGWRTPTRLPNLRGDRAISIDIETYDPNLVDNGPGYVRPGDFDGGRDGYICGVSIATIHDQAWYFPLRHPDSDNIDERVFFDWLNDTLDTPRVTKVGANLMYDIGWIQSYGISVRGPLLDVQFAEPLIDENRYTYDLESLLYRYAGESKDTSLLYQWCADAFGGSAKDQRANIWRTPARLVGPYAEQDARGPMVVLPRQIKELRRLGLYDLFLLECALIPLLLDMYAKGVRVDVDNANTVQGQVREEQVRLQEELDSLAGFHVSVTKRNDLADVFDNLGIAYPRSAKGVPSFRKDFLSSVHHPIADLIKEIRRFDKAIGTFVDSYIIERNIRGRIHAQYHPLRSDDGGTVSGRFSSSGPNMQNIPARDKRLGPLIRGLFRPDEGVQFWRRYDYSQIEYRMLAHFAVGNGSDAVRTRYNEQPDTDFHKMVEIMIADKTGQFIGRDLTKNVNFGLVYGMMKRTLMNYLKLGPTEADALFEVYHANAPFVRKTYEYFMNLARAQKYVETILGRRRNFNLFEPAQSGVWASPLPYSLARERWGYVKPAGIHKACNAVLQGSAADIIKAAMLQGYEAGIYDVVGVPLVTVHDELGFNDNDTPQEQEAFAELTNIMQTCVKARVPILVSTSRGKTWGEAK